MTGWSTIEEVQRAAGADALVPLAREAARHDLRVYLFGATAGSLAEASRNLVALCGDDLSIAGTAAPGPGFDPEGPAADAAIEHIRGSGARLCFLALKAPTAEIFAARALARCADCAFVPVGDAVARLAGARAGAPHHSARSFARLADLLGTLSRWRWRLH
jgi:UDP-N-acetyl-D-mannosaminuronic acid transferase (WecB/TagA/CpsF family)